MTTDYHAREDTVIDQMAARWSDQGYTLLRHPSRGQIPDFLRPYRPDALAIGREPQLVIEVVRDDPVGAERLRRIQKMVKGHADWRLEVLYDGARSTGKIPAASLGEIHAATTRVRALFEAGDKGAALLMAWATLEALTRILEPARAEHGLSPGETVEILTSLGHILQSEADGLRRLAAARNALVHGQLGIDVELADLRIFADLLEALAAVAEARGVDRRTPV